VTSVAPFEKEELEKMLDLVNNIEGSSGKQLRSQFTPLMPFMAGTVDGSFAHTRCVVGMFILRHAHRLLTHILPARFMSEFSGYSDPLPTFASRR